MTGLPPSAESLNPLCAQLHCRQEHVHCLYTLVTMALDSKKLGEWQRHILRTKSGFKSSVIKNYDMHKHLLEDLTSTYTNSTALGDP